MGLSGVLLLLGLAASGGAQEVRAPLPVRLLPCRLPDTKEDARCGELRVSEDRGARKGRMIPIRIAVFPALGAPVAADPLFFLAGGPGQSAVEMAPGIAEDFVLIRQRRDIVFVDLRGTGGSNPLRCDLYGGPGGLQSSFGEMFPSARVAACREDLQKRADLRRYTTTLAVEDLEDARQALGFARINLFGTSYGTRVAQVYSRRYPKQTRSIVLKGVIPMGLVIPTSYPRDAERALTLLLESCAAQEACHRAFPRPREELREVLARLESKPAEVSLEDPASRVRETVKLERGTFAETLRNMLYSTSRYREIPLVIHEAFEGRFEPIALLTRNLRRGATRAVAFGMFLSVTCAEDIPFLDVPLARREAKGTFLGEYRLREQMRACAVWPRGEIPGDFHDPPASDVPALLFSGDWDPVTPPEGAEKTARGYRDSLSVVQSFQSHSGFTECLLGLMKDFLESGSARQLDTGCLRDAAAAVFALSR